MALNHPLQNHKILHFYFNAAEAIGKVEFPPKYNQMTLLLTVKEPHSNMAKNHCGGGGG